MSQQQTFGGGSSSPNPKIELIQGTAGTATGPDPATFTVDFTSSTGDLIITTDPVTFTADFKLADKFTDTATTVGAVTADLITITLPAVAGTFQFEARVKAYNASTPTGAGYNLFASILTDGATATLLGQQPILNEPAAMLGADAYFVVSGNDAIIRVLGVAGLTILWEADAEVT